jgi:hypothetical protein
MLISLRLICGSLLHPGPLGSAIVPPVIGNLADYLSILSHSAQKLRRRKQTVVGKGEEWRRIGLLGLFLGSWRSLALFSDPSHAQSFKGNWIFETQSTSDKKGHPGTLQVLTVYAEPNQHSKVIPNFSLICSPHTRPKLLLAFGNAGIFRTHIAGPNQQEVSDIRIR